MKDNNTKTRKKIKNNSASQSYMIKQKPECECYSLDKEKMTKYATAMYQNVCIGMQSINDLLPSVKNQNLYDELKQEYNEFKKTQERLMEEAHIQQIELKDNNFFKKSRLWLSIKFSTLFNKDVRHVAEMMTIGTIMGLNDVYKAHADNKCVNKQLDNIADELEKLMEKNYSNLKTFIKVQKNN